jgi:nitronate monooxygenase
MLGAQGVQIGTAFLACEESAASPLHRDRLFNAEPTQTALTRAFTGRLARGLRNRFMDEMADSRALFAPYPVQAWLTAQLRAAALKRGRGDLLSLWSGQSVPLLRHRRARDLAAGLLAETDSRLASGGVETPG